MKVSGDTIDYNFRKYTDGTENVLADILAKLPGLEMDEKGQVRANGKPVDKITVNGQNFFGSQNEQITKNMPVDFIDKIQLNNNYSEYSLLRGFNTKRSTVINVDVDSLHRGRVTGNVEGWGGYKKKYRTSVNLYSFGTKKMWGLHAKQFNTGEEMMSLMDYIKTIGGIQSYAEHYDGEASIIKGDCLSWTPQPTHTSEQTPSPQPMWHGTLMSRPNGTPTTSTMESTAMDDQKSNDSRHLTTRLNICSKQRKGDDSSTTRVSR